MEHAESETATVVCISIATTLVMCQRCGLYITFLDVSSNFTGFVVGFVFGIIAMLIQPIILGSVLDNAHSGIENYR